MASSSSSGRPPHLPESSFDSHGRRAEHRYQGKDAEAVHKAAVSGARMVEPLSETIAISRPKPGLLRHLGDTPGGMARFALPGHTSEIAEIAGDARLSSMTVAHVAANRLQSIFLNRRARKAERAAALVRAASPDLPPIQVPERARAIQHQFLASIKSSAMVRRERGEFAASATHESDRLMAGATDFQGKKIRDLSRDASRLSLGVKDHIATSFENEMARKAYTPAEAVRVQRFITRMESVANQVHASMYFSGDDQHKILASGALFGKHTRQGLGMGGESHTSDADDRRLGNHDHVFFFLEHRDSPMRKATRFTAASTEDGIVSSSHAAASEDAIAPGSRRISFPLEGLMQKGTWAMKQDFLSPEGALGKALQPHENFVASPARDPQIAARHFMHQFALGALDLQGMKNARGRPNASVLDALHAQDDRSFVETVFKDHLRPQLMVPSVVNLNTRGGIIDAPVGDKHLIDPAHGAGALHAPSSPRSSHD